MTSSEPPQGAPARRPRRAVRLAGTVGGDDANLISSHPSLATATPAAATPAAATSDLATSEPAALVDGTPDDATPDDATLDPGTPDDATLDDWHPDSGAASAREGGPRSVPTGPDPVIATRSADDSDVGWGDRATDSNDDRLHQDKPPHW
ncbi:hypothetical protein [Cellulomonas sp. P5_C5]